MDIKDIKRAMDNMPMGDGSAFAEISVGPAKHEQFWMNITARLRWLCCYASLGLPDGLFIMACRIPWKERQAPLWWLLCRNPRQPGKLP